MIIYLHRNSVQLREEELGDAAVLKLCFVSPITTGSPVPPAPTTNWSYEWSTIV
jgi:hypothetical protein